MKFWNRMRLVGNLILLACAALALVIAMLHEGEAPASERGAPARSTLQGGTSGL